jgi:hypothetical protein
MFDNMLAYNGRFLQLSVMATLLCSFHNNIVFGQTGNETSQISEELGTWADWLSTPIIITVVTIAASIYIGPLIANRWQNRRNEIELKSKLAADISECVMKTLVAIMQVEEFYSSKKQRNNPGNEVNVLEDLPQKLKDTREHEYYEGFKVESHVIQSKIQAYFEGCLKAWNVLIDLVQFVEKLSEEKGPVGRKKVIDDHLEPDKFLNEYEPHKEEKKQLNLEEPVFKVLLDEAKRRYSLSKRHNSEKPKEIELDKFVDKLLEMEIEAWYEVKHVIVDRKNNIITYILHTKTKTPKLR